jgi:hypothetical protein
MAVIVKYIVVRNGEEKMTFATKKEADAYDKMLDIADNLFEFLESSKIKLNDDQLEAISLLMAENKDTLIPILRGVKSKAAPAKKPAKKQAVKADKEKQAAPGEKSGEASPGETPKKADNKETKSKQEKAKK